MKKYISIIAMLVIVLVAVNSVAANTVTDLTEVEFDNLIADNTVAATLVFRAGGNSDWEIYASDGTTSSTQDFAWGLDTGNSIVATWDQGVNSKFELAVTPPSSLPIVVGTFGSGAWFNTILFSVENTHDDVLSLDLTSNSIDGEGFRDMSLATYEWDGVRINLDGYDSTHQDSITLSSILNPDMYGSVVPLSNDFRGEIHFLQVPEPATISLISIAGLVTLMLRRVVRFNPY